MITKSTTKSESKGNLCSSQRQDKNRLQQIPINIPAYKLDTKECLHSIRLFTASNMITMNEKGGKPACYKKS